MEISDYGTSPLDPHDPLLNGARFFTLRKHLDNEKGRNTHTNKSYTIPMSNC